ncbi:hypothetical protein OAX78_01085 [Planctomycetota bacterium]|nr:hypothetical protein [Planctomycetota bacterium]
MRKITSFLLAGGLTVALLGCPPPSDGTDGATDGGEGGETPTSTPADGEGGGDAPVASSGPSLDHVSVGQKYKYAMQGGIEQVWEVTAKADNSVNYTVTTVMGGNAVGDPQEQVWQYTAPAATTDAPATDAPAAETSREAMTVSGVEFDCLVTTSGENKSWSTMTGDAVTFPGALKVMTGENVVMELTAIE